MTQRHSSGTETARTLHHLTEQVLQITFDHGCLNCAKVKGVLSVGSPAEITTKYKEFCPEEDIFMKFLSASLLRRKQKQRLARRDDPPTFRNMQWFQGGASGAVQQRWPEVHAAVRGFFGGGRQPGRCSHWGQAERVLRPPVCGARVLPGAGLRAADTHAAPGANRELRRRSAEVQQRLVLDLSRAGGFGGAILLWGVRGQRLHAARGGAAWTAAQSVTYAGAREEAYKALIKTGCTSSSEVKPSERGETVLQTSERLLKVSDRVWSNWGVMAHGANHRVGTHSLHRPGTGSGCRGCGASWAPGTDRWPGSCESRVGSGAEAGACWGPEVGGRSGGPERSTDYETLLVFTLCLSFVPNMLRLSLSSIELDDISPFNFQKM